MRTLNANVSHTMFILILLSTVEQDVFDQCHVFLSSAAGEQPLGILLDSLDQLSPGRGKVCQR